MQGKGMGNVKESVSAYASDRGLYTVQAIPKFETLANCYRNDYTSKSSEQELISRLKSSKFTQNLKNVLKFIFICLLAPFYYVLYYFPSWTKKHVVEPVIRKIVAILKPPLTAVAKKIKAIAIKIRSIANKIHQKIEMIANLIKNSVLAITVPINKWLNEKFQRFLALMRRAIQAILRPIKIVVGYISSAIYKVEQLLGRLLVKINETIHKAWMQASKLIYDIVHPIFTFLYQAIYQGSIFLRKSAYIFLGSLKIIPKYLNYLTNSLLGDLQGWIKDAPKNS